MLTSTLSAWSFANHGPLTTTFTAPASCFTSASQIQLGLLSTNTDTNATTLAPFLGLCNTGLPYWANPGGCVPSASEIESQYAAVDTDDPIGTLIIDYFSPGLYCPSGYVTVGVATNDAGTITSSGDGFVPPTTDYQQAPFFNPGPNILLQGLDRGETAVLCCPDSFQVDVYGNCFSELPTQPLPTEVCYINPPEEDYTVITSTVTIFGTPITDGVLQWTNAVPMTETSTLPISDPDRQQYAVITVAPMITLVHNAAEASSTMTSGGSSRAKTGNMKFMLLSCWIVSLMAGIYSSTLF